MAKARPGCVDKGCDLPKCRQSTRWCWEGWLRRQPIGIREKQRQRRLALVPPDLRRKVCPERLWPPGRRWCSGCQSFVLLTDCTGARCRTCASVAGHAGRLIAEYGVTREFFEALLELQGGVCAVCGANIRARRPAMDHDHVTGRPRGLVCADNDWGCNMKILAKMDHSGDPLAMAYRLVGYFTAPPAAKVQARA